MTPKTIYRQRNEINTTYVSIKSLSAAPTKAMCRERENERRKKNSQNKMLEREKLDLIVSSERGFGGLMLTKVRFCCIRLFSFSSPLARSSSSVSLFSFVVIVCQKPFNA